MMVAFGSKLVDCKYLRVKHCFFKVTTAIIAAAGRSKGGHVHD